MIEKLLLQIHLCNAWILIVPVWLGGMIASLLHKKGIKRAANMSWYTKKDLIVSWGAMSFMTLFMIASVFISVNFSSIWFYIGALLIVIGFIGHFAAKRAFMTAERTAPVTGGIYNYSRNPMYTFMSLSIVGTAISAKSIILISLWFCSVVCMHVLILGEERYCKNEYGESYIIYMKKVPRYLLFF